MYDVCIENIKYKKVFIDKNYKSNQLTIKLTQRKYKK